MSAQICIDQFNLIQFLKANISINELVKNQFVNVAISGDFHS